MDESSVGVVMVNYWKDGSDTIEALDSLYSASPRAAHVVVVDNGSEDLSISRLRAWIQNTASATWVTLLPLDRNTGFSGGNNAGIRVLRDDPRITAFLLLNNDATVAPDFFTHMGAAVAARPDAALYGATIFEYDRKTVWYAGGTERPSRALMLHDITIPATSEPRETQFVTGCAMLIPRDTFDSLGGLAEIYFPGYWEDAEYSFRARQLGPLVYAPGAVVYHKVGASMGSAKVSPRVAYIENRHRAVFVRRNYRGLQRVVSLAYLIVTKPARLLKEIARGNPRVGWAILQGAMAGVIRGETGTPPGSHNSFR
ncbi:MAG: glycosyltransferase family 2 protein [Gemmatimonadaceae bacterium]